jgi:hypothetical protein
MSRLREPYPLHRHLRKEAANASILDTSEVPVALRFTYESTYRSRWNQGVCTEHSVVLRTEAVALRSLPYDLLQAGQPCTLTIADLFPNLSYPIVAALERSDFDALYRAQRRHHPGPLGATGERGVYQAAPARPVQDKKLVVWLTEAALLTSRVHTGVLTTLAQAPALFPFHLAPLYAIDLAGHSRLEPFCHGLNEDIVRFREHGRRIKSPSPRRT